MELINEVRRKVQAYLDENQKRSFSSLARKSGVSYSTVRRLVCGETTHCGIDSTIIPILSVFMTRQEIHELISRYDSKFAEVWKPLFNDYQFINPSEKMTTWKEYDQYILSLANHPEGVTVGRITKDLGEMAGVKRADELVSSGLLKKVGNRYHTFAENYSDTSVTGVLERIAISAKSYNKENIGLGAHYWLFSESVCDEAYDEIRKAGLDYITQVNQIKVKYKEKKPTRIGQFSLLGNFIDLRE